jgi:acetoin utilization deacetylase AcuC-like enzyme
VKAFYSDRFVLPLPDGHRFPMAKYRLLRERIAAELSGVALAEPPPASDGVLALAHTPDWIERLSLGRLTALEQRAIGFPWSEAMVERSRRSVGATIAACRAAIDDGATMPGPTAARASAA